MPETPSAPTPPDESLSGESPSGDLSQVEKTLEEVSPLAENAGEAVDRLREAANQAAGQAVDPLRQAWITISDTLHYGLLGVNLGQVIGFVLLVLVAFTLRRLVGAALNRLARFGANRNSRAIWPKVVEAMVAPLRLLILVAGLALAVAYLGLVGTMQLVSSRIIESLVAIVVFWSLFNLVGPLSRMFLVGLLRIFTQEAMEWLLKAVRALFLFLGAATVLEAWGVQVGPLLAGLGLFGVAVALGAQDLFKNLIAGLLILAEKRFHRGDWVKVDGVVEGIVETIGFRSTLIRRFDKAPVFVPNTQLSDAPVINFSSMTYRLVHWVIAVKYDTTVPQLRTIVNDIRQYILDSDEFVSPLEAYTFVNVDGFSPSSINILVYCYTRTTLWGDWLAAKERLAWHIKTVILRAGTNFAMPSTQLYVERVPTDEGPQPFVPPEDPETTVERAGA